MLRAFFAFFATAGVGQGSGEKGLRDSGLSDSGLRTIGMGGWGQFEGDSCSKVGVKARRRQKSSRRAVVSGAVRGVVRRRIWRVGVAGEGGGFPPR